MKLFSILSLLRGGNRRRRTKPEIKWHSYPQQPGWYLSFAHGRGFDELYWPGDDDMTFEFQHREGTSYLGPFQLPIH